MAFVWEVTTETIHSPLGCLQGGYISAVLLSAILDVDFLHVINGRGATRAEILKGHLPTVMYHQVYLYTK